MANQEANSFHFECQHCGRQWITGGHRTGFVKSAAYGHKVICAKRTPKQRREANIRDEMRWKAKPPQSDIYNPLTHPGLTDRTAQGERGE